VSDAKTATRNYAKRQLTWLRNQVSWPRLQDCADLEGALRILEAGI